MGEKAVCLSTSDNLNPHQYLLYANLALETIIENPLTVPSADLQSFFVAQDYLF